METSKQSRHDLQSKWRFARYPEFEIVDIKYSVVEREKELNKIKTPPFKNGRFPSSAYKM